MAHEMAHDSDSRGTHIHGPEFYENMVQILESRNSPTVWAAIFKDTMDKNKIEYRRLKEESKKVKAEAKVKEKLGIAAKAINIKVL